MPTRAMGGVLYGRGEWEALVARVGEDAVRGAVEAAATPDVVAAAESKALTSLVNGFRSAVSEIHSHGGSAEFPAA